MDTNYGPTIEDSNQALLNANKLLNSLEMVIDLKETYIEAPFWINARGFVQDQAFLTPDKFIDILKKCFNNMTLIEFLTSTELNDDCFVKFEDVMLKEYHYIDFNALCHAQKQALHLYHLYDE